MTLISFQLTISGSAQQLASNRVNTSVTLTAKSTNTASIEVGNSSAVSTSNSFILEKGQSITLPLANGNTNSIYVIGTANDILSVIGV